MTFSRELGVLAEVALAMVLGGLLVLEREVAHKPAGLRTHALVAGAAALLVGLMEALLAEVVFPNPSAAMRADPVLVIQAVVTAVGFLGAGTIIRRSGEAVEGLTTAASILFASALGIACALRQFSLAVGATILALATLKGVKLLEERLGRRRGA